jgi:predicted DNA-binding transcriptional regulator AlpA
MRSLINNFLDMTLRDILMACFDLTEDEMCSIIDNFLNISDTLNANKDKFKVLCRTEAYQYLRISRSSFDAKVKDGVLPKGIKTPGRGPVWFKKDLDEYLKNREKKLKAQLV